MAQPDLSKKYKCKMGDASFDTEAELHEHEIKMHMQPDLSKKYKCMMGDASFDTEAELHEHEHNVHHKH